MANVDVSQGYGNSALVPRRASPLRAFLRGRRGQRCGSRRAAFRPKRGLAFRHMAASGSTSTRQAPEGHGIRYGANGQVIGVTIVNAKWLLDRDGYLKITVPHEVRVQPDELAAALS
jgi:uncharacterized protein YuzE